MGVAPGGQAGLVQEGSRATGLQGTGAVVTMRERASGTAHLGLLAVGYRWERNDIALGIHEAGVVFSSVK